MFFTVIDTFLGKFALSKRYCRSAVRVAIQECGSFIYKILLPALESKTAHMRRIYSPIRDNVSIDRTLQPLNSVNSFSALNQNKIMEKKIPSTGS